MYVDLMYVDAVVHIAAPKARVWGLFADVDGWARWNPTIVSSSAWRGQPWVPGFRLRQTVLIGRRRLSFRPRVTESDPGTFVTWEGRSLGITGVHSWYFEEETGGTRVTTIEQFNGPGLFLMRILFKPEAVQTMFRASLEGLKLAAEAIHDP